MDLFDNFLKSRNVTNVDKYDYLKKIKIITRKLFPDKVIRIHSFRKYFSTQISKIDLNKYNSKINIDIKINFKEHLIGHKVNYSSAVYITHTQIIDNYYDLWKPLKASLCIDCEIIDNINEEIESLKEGYDSV